MKRISLFVILTLSIASFSCSKGDIDKLVGNWRSDTQTQYPKFSFASDKKFTWATNSTKTNTGTYRSAGENLFLRAEGKEYKFRYSVDGNKLTMERNDEIFGDALSSIYSLIKE